MKKNFPPRKPPIENFVFGRNPVLEALNSQVNIEQIFIDEALTGDYEKTIRKLAKVQNVALKRVPGNYFKKFPKMNHQSIIAEISPVKYVELESVLEMVYAEGRSPLLLLLDKIKDVRNIGAIARSAYAFGVDAMLLPIKNAAPINEFAVKASSGALLHMNLCRFNSQQEVTGLLKDSGINLVATTLDASDKLDTTDLSGPLCLVIGSEEKGVNRELLKLCDQTIRINHSPQMESLNAGVATGIVLHAIYNSRQDKNS